MENGELFDSRAQEDIKPNHFLRAVMICAALLTLFAGSAETFIWAAMQPPPIATAVQASDDGYLNFGSGVSASNLITIGSSGSITASTGTLLLGTGGTSFTASTALSGVYPEYSTTNGTWVLSGATTCLGAGAFHTAGGKVRRRP